MNLRQIAGTWHVRCRVNGKDCTRSLKLKGSPKGKPNRYVIRIAQEKLKELQGVRSEEKKVFEATYSQLADDYLRLKLKHSEETPNNAAYHIQHTKDFFGKYRVWEISKELIVKYENMRIAAKIKESTLNREKQYLRAILLFAVKLKKVSRSNVLDVIDLLDYADESPFIRNRNVTTEELKAIVSKCDIHAAVAIIMQSVSMMRIGEVLRAKWTDIDWSGRKVFLGKTKNGEQRYAPLAINHRNGIVDTELIQILKVWQVFQTTEHRRLKYLPPEYIITKRGKPVVKIRTAFNCARDEAKVDNIRPHDFRHMATTRFKRIGHDDNKIRLGSGHKDNDSYQRYLDFTKNINELTGISGEEIPGTVSAREFISYFNLAKYESMIVLPVNAELKKAG